MRLLTGKYSRLNLISKGYGGLNSIPLFILIVFIIFPYFLRAHTSDSNELLQKAEELKLYDERYWHVLLHYKPSGFGFKSLIDDPRFFLSPDGKKNPKAELEATITALFESKNKDDSHPICRFIVRYEWLKEKLNIDESAFSDIRCNDFNNVFNNVQPTTAVLIFPASYMNNPASMFGHTLLRIDSSYESKLLSHAVNYAAQVENAGILYPIKGIFGLYKGYFKVFPYYDMVKDYNDTEQRDMWEYPLNFSKEEVRRMFLHLWELKDIYSYYYFFDENCSYNLLFLLESARPSLQLTDGFQLWAIPVDTLRAVIDNGLVNNIEYRPSMATRIRHIASLLNENERKLVLKMVKDELPPDKIMNMNSVDSINILNLAIEILQYKYNKQLISKDKYLKLFLSTLNERSKLGNSESASYEIPAPTKPEDGHFSNRASFGIRIRKKSSFFEFSYRPAYHSLIDPDQGFTEGSQIIFLNTSVRGYTDGRIKLESLDVIDIVSISPRDKFFSPLSWKIKTGLIRKNFREGQEHLIYQLNPGFGFAYENKLLGLWYVMGETNFNLGGMFKDMYAVGIGPQIGVIKKLTDFWKINIITEALFYGIRERFEEYSASAIQTFRLNQNNSINLSIDWDKIFNNEQAEVKLNWNYYF